MTICELAALPPAMPNAMRYSVCTGGESLHHHPQKNEKVY
jgi:hypothetical protein